MDIDSISELSLPALSLPLIALLESTRDVSSRPSSASDVAAGGRERDDPDRDRMLLNLPPKPPELEAMLGARSRWRPGTSTSLDRR